VSIMKSNVTIRSNLFIRQPVPVKEDRTFVRQVKGKTALCKLIAQFPELEASGYRHSVLSQRQVAELVWETPCTKCGAIPEGPIWRNGNLEIAFRCPLAVCRAATYRARTVSLDHNIVRTVTSALGLPLSEVVDVALRNIDGKDLSTIGIASSRRPFTVRLSPSQYHFLTDSDIEAALTALLTE
jgi:hypothetical protein